MDNKDKNNLHMVRVDWEDLEKKVHDHRMKQLRTALIIVGSIAALIIIYLIVVTQKHYTDYRITDTADRMDTAATEFVEYNGGFLKYSNDGAICTTIDNETVWNQSFEMAEPMVSICEGYVAIADREGKVVRVVDEKGKAVEVGVNLPITKTSVAANGVLAVLMEEGNSSYLALYNRDGEQIAEGAIHVENSGTPMDIALSYDGKKLGVSVLNISDGKAQTTVYFYNFGAVGQNQIDNLVATYDYPDTIIPEIHFVSANRMIAFADSGILTFEGSEKPEQAGTVNVEAEIQSIFYNESYIGVVVSDPDTESARNVTIYNTKGGMVSQFQVEIQYDRIGFLSNNEICLYNEKECQIFKVNGKDKFYHEFEDATLDYVFHLSGQRGYLFLTDSEMQKVALRIIGGSTEEDSSQWVSPMDEVENQQDETQTDENQFDNTDEIYDIDAEDDSTRNNTSDYPIADENSTDDDSDTIDGVVAE